MLSAKRSSTRSALLVAAFAVAAGGASVAVLLGSPAAALIGAALAGLAGVLIVLHVLLTERRRHEVAEEELTLQAQFLEALVDAFGALAATLDVSELLELSRSEAGRLFGARAELLSPGDRRRPGPSETELLVPLRVRGEELATVRLVRDDDFDRDAPIRAKVFGGFASRAIENARLLAEATVREAERARLSEQLVTAEQEERRRLALFLHDTSMQSLSGIALMLDASLYAIDDGRPEDAHAILAGALDRHRATIRALRDLSFNLEPVVLRDQGLRPAVAALAEQVGLEQEIRIEADVDAAEGLAEGAKATLYQIIREALDASVRRGPPTHISIRVAATDDGGAAMTISDDAPAERRRSVFEGLSERARAISGELEMLAEGASGTTFRVVLPPPAQADTMPAP